MATAELTHQVLIGGTFTDSVSGATMDVINPATGETIAQVPSCTAEDVDNAVQAAKDALPEWLDATPGERAALLYSLADVIDENAEELAQLESRNVGKPIALAREEMGFSADNLRFFAGASRVLEGKSTGEYIKGYTSMIRREPIGIVAGICPWNYPLMMAVWKLGPALAAGNVQILKPSEQTPLSLLRFAELAKDVIPAGVLQVLTGDGVPVGDRLVKHPDIGLVVAHRRRQHRQADREERVRLAEARAPRARRQGADGGVRRRRSRGGRRGDQDRRVRELRPGLHRAHTRHRRPEDLQRAPRGARAGGRVDQRRRPASSEDIEMGPMISKDQQDRVLGFLERAKGATVLTGGTAIGDRGYFVKPTVDHRRRADRRDHPGRGLRPRRDGAAVRRRRAGDRLGERRPLRPRRVGLDARHRPGATRPRGSCSSARSGSTTTSCRSRPRCRTAASSSPATARTCPRTRSRSTRRSSTWWRSCSCGRAESSASSAGEGSHSPAFAFARTCSGFVAPAITETTAGWAASPPTATSRSERPCAVGPRASALRRGRAPRRRSCGRRAACPPPAAARDVTLPVSRPLASGKYGMKPSPSRSHAGSSSPPRRARATSTRSAPRRTGRRGSRRARPCAPVSPARSWRCRTRGSCPRRRAP